eukprot:jgi/Mesvir1/19750/Mv13056-RA.1
MARKLRVMAFHGFRTSAAAMRLQLYFAKWHQLDDILEVVCLDGPFPAEAPPEPEVARTFDPPYYEWYNVDKEAFENETTHYKGLKETLTYINDYARLHGPFDGVLGFSQGAALAALVCLLQRKGDIMTDVPPLRFCMIVSGLRIFDSSMTEIFDKEKYAWLWDMPSIHFLGEKDFLLRENQKLARHFPGAVLVHHKQAHTIPRLGKSQCSSRCVQVTVFKSLYSGHCIQVTVSKSLYPGHCIQVTGYPTTGDTTLFPTLWQAVMMHFILLMVLFF